MERKCQGRVSGRKENTSLIETFINEYIQSFPFTVETNKKYANYSNSLLRVINFDPKKL